MTAVPQQASQIRPVDKPPSEFLKPTYFANFDNPAVSEFARDRVGNSTTDTEKAIKLFYAVRDEIRYNPYTFSLRPEAYRASFILENKQGWCVTKAALMTASARSVGVPARMGYADVRNHLATPRFRDLVGTDLMSYHGYVELWLDERWIKVTPVFDINLCRKLNVKAQDFDGTADALLQPFDHAGQKHMEYVVDRGIYDDVPLDEIEADFRVRYPRYVEEMTKSERERGDFLAEAAAAGKTA
ncbi:MAG: transglutaminase family protein [Alphaproteobacteria bacterium]